MVGVDSGRTVTYSYDLNGNRISKVGNHASLPKHYYAFDTHDRLIDVRENSANGTVIFSASYDHRTRRLTTMEGTGSQLALKYFRYDGGDSFQELASNTSTIQTEFVRGSGMGGGIGSILYSDRRMASGQLEFFTYNAVGHTVALSSEDPPTIAAAPGGGSGPEVVKSDQYGAFGNICRGAIKTGMVCAIKTGKASGLLVFCCWDNALLPMCARSSGG